MMPPKEDTGLHVEDLPTAMMDRISWWGQSQQCPSKLDQMRKVGLKKIYKSYSRFPSSRSSIRPIVLDIFGMSGTSNIQANPPLHIIHLLEAQIFLYKIKLV